MKNTPIEISIPRYISSFELEEARISQAIEKSKMKLSPDFLKEILRKIKAESVNAEFALHAVATNFPEQNEVTKKLLLNLLKR